MTAFASVEAGNFCWEIRTVNHRFLDISFRMPESCRSMEVPLRALVKKYLSRGKVDCTLKVLDHAVSTRMVVREDIVTSLVEAAGTIDRMTGNESPLPALELLKWPDVIEGGGTDPEKEAESLTTAFREALEKVTSMREREGSGLQSIMIEQLDALRRIVRDVRRDAPEIAERQAQRLAAKLEEYRSELDPGRLEQEFVILAHKSDIVEELDRLETHMEEVRKTLASHGPVGRRLDFLMQELNREANTLSSKATIADTTLQAVDLKVLIEQMREQIQNIE